MQKNKWIQKAVPDKNKGLLHKKLGVPLGEKIPASKLQKAKASGGTLAKEANFAITMRGLKGGNMKSEKAKHVKSSHVRKSIKEHMIENHGMKSHHAMKIAKAAAEMHDELHKDAGEPLRKDMKESRHKSHDEKMGHKKSSHRKHMTRQMTKEERAKEAGKMMRAR